MKKSWIIKPVVAAAACATLMLGVSRIPDFTQVGKELQNSSSPNIAEAISNSFTVKVLAAGKKKTVEKKKPTPVLNQDGEKYSIWGGTSVDDKDLDYKMFYRFAFPVTCEGKNIDTITYSINKGFFWVYAKKDVNYVLNGERYTGLDKLKYTVLEGDTKNYRDYDDVKNDRFDIYNLKCYKSYTVSADKQSTKDAQVSIYNEMVLSKESYYKIFDEKNTNLQDKLEAHNEALRDTFVTCDIKYKDGTHQSAKIKVGSAIMIPEGEKQYSKDVYVTYELI